MFDDLKDKKQQEGVVSSESVPANAASPESPFTPVQSDPSAPTPPPARESVVKPDTPVEDIFSRTDATPPPDMGTPGPDLPATPAGAPPASAPAEDFSGHVSSDTPHIPRPQLTAEDGGWRSKKYFIFGIIGIIILIGGYFAYSSFFAVSDPEVIPFEAQEPSEPVVVTPAPTEATVEPVAPDVPAQPTTTQVPPVTPPLDTDADGLTDENEQALGTNPFSIDSDQDGLTDQEEVVTYGTNPLNPDSDNDTYLDGEEVMNGFNPLGPGTLN